MKFVWIAVMVWAAGASAQQPDANINERYKVESVELTGIDHAKLSRGLRNEINGLIGEQFSQQKLDRLISRLAADFPDYSVSRRISRGDKPNFIRIVLELQRSAQTDHFGLSLPLGVYNSKLGWSGEVDGTVRFSHSSFTAGVLSDNETLADRFTGVRAVYANSRLGTRLASFAFELDSFHDIWSPASLAAAETPLPSGEPGINQIYRWHRNIQPALTLAAAGPLKFSFGASFQPFQLQYPAARTEAANAVITSLRYDRQLETSGSSKQRLEAGYRLRAATKVLGSDFVYARHAWDFRYVYASGRQGFSERFGAGAIAGQAPIFERFVLGTAETLRGWTKYDLAPLGASRAFYNSVEYKYRDLVAFYDMGAAWSRGQDVSPKHSAGVGVRAGDFALLVAFPFRAGHFEPMFIMGLNI
jgi:hypothetical protein